jgi:cytidine deaminase
MTYDLITRARQVAANAYAPYSGFAVGCVVETTDGKRFDGANMENASYGVGMCAEVGALMAASLGSGLASVERVFVAGGLLAAGGQVAGEEVVTPCGRCRQLIAEAAQLSGRDVEVVCASGDGTIVKRHFISELLPHAFGPASLAGASSAIAAE